MKEAARLQVQAEIEELRKSGDITSDDFKIVEVKSGPEAEEVIRQKASKPYKPRKPVLEIDYSQVQKPRETEYTMKKLPDGTFVLERPQVTKFGKILPKPNPSSDEGSSVVATPLKKHKPSCKTTKGDKKQQKLKTSSSTQSKAKVGDPPQTDESTTQSSARISDNNDDNKQLNVSRVRRSTRVLYKPKRFRHSEEEDKTKGDSGEPDKRSSDDKTSSPESKKPREEIENSETDASDSKDNEKGQKPIHIKGDVNSIPSALIEDALKSVKSLGLKDKKLTFTRAKDSKGRTIFVFDPKQYKK